MSLLLQNIFKLFGLLILFFLCNEATCNSILEYSNPNKELDLGKKVSIYEDASNTLELKNIKNKEFFSSKSKVPNLGMSSSSFWIKFKVKNNTNYKNLILTLSLPLIDQLEFYIPTESNHFKKITLGEAYPFHYRKYNDPNFIVDIPIKKNETKEVYLKVKSNEAIQLPITIGSEAAVFKSIKRKDLLSGIYCGIMIVMILYNLFVYFSVKDKSYILYVIYIALVLLTQTILQGYPFQYLWPSYPMIAQYSFFIVPTLVGISSVFFMVSFLNLKQNSIKLYKLSMIICIPYLISLGFALLGNFKLSVPIMEFSAGIVSFFMLYTGIFMIKKGYQPAKYFVVAWSIFLCGVIIYILKDFEILPFNNYTRYTMQIGSAVETVLLSFALAARINIYKKERLEALQEKETLVREQNIILEKQVKKRTQELELALKNLKEAQSQLVDAEKMSSLGQLTAGIAHEINNPINFVSSNISPLRQDIEDLEQIINKYEELKNADNVEEKFKEIEQLKNELDFEYLKKELPSIINGIEDGATRTKEIVSGLRNFSRLDEVEYQQANINEGIESTLILIKSKLTNINLVKNLSPLPLINCNPSKLNQLFMNLIDNAISAIEEKGIENGKITLETSVETNDIIFKISDNGIGIKQEILPKIFDPFFTTKDVGKGTGLGLSISRSIIEAHEGTIEVNSEVNKGTEITVKIPNK